MIEVTRLLALLNNGVRPPRLRDKEVEVDNWQVHEGPSHLWSPAGLHVHQLFTSPTTIYSLTDIQDDKGIASGSFSLQSVL